MPAPRPADIVERARVLVVTSTLPLAAIAAEIDVSIVTLRNWIKKYGWQRPAGAPHRALKLPPDKAGAVQRLFEGGARVNDLALLLGCDGSYVHQFARARAWTRRKGASKTASSPSRDELAAIEAALRDPATARPDMIRHIERLIALAAADAVATGDARPERSLASYARLVALVKSLPEPPAAPAHKDTDALDDADPFPDANDLIAEIARRFEEFCAAEDAGAFSLRPAQPSA
jgi:transposase-like protein